MHYSRLKREYMADAKVNLTVSDSGSIDQTTKKASKLKQELQQAAAAASKVHTPSALSAAKEGMIARARAKDSQASGTSRSLGEGTGAAGRDFAKLASAGGGLGGLVQIYATFAANIFAVSAAFTALSKAADITNLVKGLDQLGAAGGRNLAALSKQLVQVTDGAISLETSLRSVANASAGGLSDASILRLGKVARSASQALGVAMPDAVNRLTRGITKLEPELLDEIGIMVRLDDATAAYAASIGKTASALTDFERRQAFANAVLEQGEKKFGAIQLEANPYAKLLASVQNLAYGFGSIINTFLNPFLSILNSSPTALATAIGGMATILLRQAIPAFSNWRERMDEAAKSSRNLALEAAKTQKKFADERMESKLVAQQLASIDKVKKSMQELAKTKYLKSTQNLLPNDPREYDKIQNAQLDALDAQAKKLDAIVAENKLSAKTLENRKMEAAAIRKMVAEIKVAQADLAKIDTAPTKLGLVDRLKYTFSAEGIADRNLAKQENKAARSGIISNALNMAPEKGAFAAWKELRKNIDLAKKGQGEFISSGQKMTALNGIVTSLSGGFKLAATSIGALLSSLSAVFFYVGIAVAAFTALNAIFSKSQKEADAFDTSIKALADSSDNVARVLDVINEKADKDVVSIKSYEALSNAFMGVSDSVKETTKSLEALVNKQSLWDRGVDAILNIFGFGIVDDIAEGLSSGVSRALDAIKDPAIKAKAAKSLSEIFSGVDIKDAGALEDYLDNLSTPAALAKLKQVDAVLGSINTEISKQTSYLTDAANNIKELGRSVQESTAKLAPKDSFSKFGNQLVSIGTSFDKVIDKPIEKLAVLNELISNTNALSVLPEDTAKKLIADKKALEELTAQLGATEKKIAAAAKIRDSSNSDNITKGQAAYDVAKAESQLKGIKAEIAKKTAEFQSIGIDIVRRGNELLLQGLTRALSEAALTFRKGVTSLAGSLGVATARDEKDIARQEYSLQLQAIDANFQVVEALTRNTIAIEQNTAQDTINRLKGTQNPEEQIVLKTARQTLSALNEAAAILKSPNLQKAISEAATSENPTLRQAAGSLSQLQQATLGASGEKAKLTANLKVTLLGLDVKEVSEAFERAGKVITAGLDKSGILESQLDTYKSLLGTYSGLTIEKEKQLALDRQNKQEQLLLLKVQEDLVKLQKLRSSGSANIAEIEAAEADLYAKIRAIVEKGEADRAAISSKYALQASEYRLSLLQRESDFRDRLDAANASVASSSLDAEVSRNSSLAELNKLSERALATEVYKLELLKEELSFRTNVSAIIRKSALEEQQLLAKRQFASPEDASKIDADIAKVRQLRDAELDAASKVFGYRSKTLSVTKDTKLETLEINKALEAQQSFFDSMAAAFGDIGSAISGVLEGIASYGKQLKDLEAQRANALSNSSSEDEKKKAEEEYAENRAKLEDKFALQQISSVKKVFKEKTAAYKILAGIEKVMHITKIAQNAKEMAMDLIKTAQSSSNSVVRGLADGAAAVAKALSSLPPPFSYAAAAATALIIKKLFGKGPSVSTSFTPSAEQRQEVQGTGTTYDSRGNKIETGFGTFGDAEAKSASIENSLRILKDNSIEGLDYTNEMVRLLTSIEQNIGGVSKSLYSVTGLRTGSLFGNAQTSTSKSGISGLFGSSSVKEIYDAGLKFTGTFIDLINNAAGSIQGFETIKKTKKNSGLFGIGGSTKVSYNTQFTNLDPNVSAEIASIFEEASNLFIESGTRLGMTVEDVYSKLAKINVDQLTSLRNLKGEELEQELTAVIGSILDVAATSLFSSLKKYSEFGEGMLETAIRIIDTNDKINLALESIGASTLNASETLTESSIAISQALATSAGGLSNFVKQTDFFRENFLTQVEQLAPIKARLEKELESLGINAPGLDPLDTREEFAALVKAIDLTTESGRSLYQSMMDISEIFASVYPETRKLVSAEELRLALIKQQIEILKLEGRVSEAIALQREEELKTLDDSLKAGQQYIWDLTDRLNLLKSESALLSALGYEYNALQINRELELRTLTEQEKQLKKQIYLAQDAQKTQELNLQILELTGEFQEAERLRRLRELDALSDTDAALQSRIYLLRDEKQLLDAKRQQDITINNLLGNSETALRLSREEELEGIDDRLKSTQLYIYALQDEATARDSVVEIYERESSALKDVIGSTKSFIQSIKDARDALLVGDLSILTPSEQYQKLKDDAMTVAAIATGIANTDAEKQAKDDAIAKLPDVTSQFLEASRNLYASSDSYTNDFNYILSILNSTTGSLESQLTEAERQLEALESNNTILGLIQTNTLSMSEALNTYLVAQQASSDAALLAAQSQPSVIPLSKTDLPDLAMSIYEASMAALSSPELGLTKPDIDLSIITTNATANTEAMITELRLVQAELKALREEQNAQTGHLIETIAESAETVTSSNEAVVDTIRTNTEWRDTRNSVQIK